MNDDTADEQRPLSRFVPALGPYDAPFTGEKPPFDPLTAGWIKCPRCQGGSWYHGDEPAACPSCEGEGIVVGPPRDGITLAPYIARAKREGWNPEGTIEAFARMANRFPVTD